MSNIGQNVNIEKKDKILTITIDLSKDFGPSKSGKSIVIASSSGNKNIEEDIFLGVNCYRTR